jgi:hypothetical protein
MVVEMGFGDLATAWMPVTGKRPPVADLPFQTLSILKVIVESGYTALIEPMREHSSVNDRRVVYDRFHPLWMENTKE